MKLQPQFSIREVLFVVFFAGLALASLQTGGILASATLCLTALLVLGFAIIAFVGRDNLQAFAIGLLVPVVAYACLLFSVGGTELDPYRAKLPTSRLLAPAFHAMTRKAWVHMGSGEFVRYFDPTTDTIQTATGSGGFPSPLGPAGVSGYATVSEWPDRTTFMSLGHVLFAMLIGYLGGKFAIVVRRHQHAVKPEE